MSKASALHRIWWLSGQDLIVVIPLLTYIVISLLTRFVGSHLINCQLCWSTTLVVSNVMLYPGSFTHCIQCILYTLYTVYYVYSVHTVSCIQ